MRTKSGRKYAKLKASKLFNEAIKLAELISTYGKAALLTLAGKGIKLDDATEILKKESVVNEYLIELYNRIGKGGFETQVL